MTYKDPKTGRERNLGPDNVGGSVWPWIGGRVILVAIAYGGWYFYDHSQKSADLSNPSPAADKRLALQRRIPVLAYRVPPAAPTDLPQNKPEAASGASSGTSGTGNVEPGTQPSQVRQASKEPRTARNPATPGLRSSRNGPASNPSFNNIARKASRPRPSFAQGLNSKQSNV